MSHLTNRDQHGMVGVRYRTGRESHYGNDLELSHNRGIVHRDTYLGAEAGVESSSRHFFGGNDLYVTVWNNILIIPLYISYHTEQKS